ncbi:MAG: thiol reductant ABC exporter subunit CydC [Pontimonas sp.]|nr:thiol reductant ABC exporter subunit CydC [Pontimonas sp.]
MRTSWSVISRAVPRGLGTVVPLLWGIAATGSAVGLLATSAWLITRAAEAPPILYLAFAIVGVRAFALGRAVFRYMERVSSHDFAFRQLARVRLWMFDRLVPLAPAGIIGVRRGGMMSTLIADVDTLQNLPLRLLAPLGSSLVIVVLGVVGVSWVSPVSGAVLAMVLLIAVVSALSIAVLVASRAEEVIAPARGDFATEVYETYQRRRVFDAFEVGEIVDRALAGRARSVQRLELRQALAIGSTAGVIMLFSGVALIAMALTVAPLVAAEALSGPAFAVVVLVPLALFEALAMVPGAVMTWRQVQASAARIEEMLPETIPAEIPVDSPALTPGIVLSPVTLELMDVSVRWPGGSAPVSNPVSLSVAPGDRVWISGPSGSGKTSLALALVRFLDYEGSYRLSGVEAKNLSQDTLRQHVVLCEQAPHLFATSIRHNLNFAKPDASDAELMAVLHRVGLAAWVRDRGGLDEPVGERGALVSGGQAQRIALARALLSRGDVIVFDEPSANVEPALADSVMRDLIGMASEDDQRIVLVISHTPLPEGCYTHTVTLGSD